MENIFDHGVFLNRKYIKDNIKLLSEYDGDNFPDYFIFIFDKLTKLRGELEELPEWVTDIDSYNICSNMYLGAFLFNLIFGKREDDDIIFNKLLEYSDKMGWDTFIYNQYLGKIINGNSLEIYDFLFPHTLMPKDYN